ncbi:MAG: hypothetical protein EHM89_00250 [Acidobacteria bacterium]|nr:MAG: hypothetical protein EHM89_00250 [Acidobacteriota bacterium]
MTISFFGQHFPDANLVDGKIFWDGHFPDGGQDPEFAVGFGPAGVATLVLDLENGFQVTYNWITDVKIKTRSGKEQRISRNDVARQSFSGSALLRADSPRTVRAQMARFAAVGAQFLLGLPHEDLTIAADASTFTVFVHSTAYSDWAKPGQRVVVARAGSFVDAVIQSVTSTTIVLDIEPGSLGNVGGVIMPAVPIFLEPQQDFPRYPVSVERWNINARANINDFAPTLATLPLGPVTLSAAFNNVTLVSRLFGLAGNAINVQFSSNAIYPAIGQLIETGYFTEFRYRPGVTTLDNLYSKLLLSSNVMMTGTWTGSDTIAAGDIFDEPLTGASEAGAVGTGATVTSYAGHPVWDKRLDNEGTAQDSVQAATEIIDHGGTPYALGTADRADWGRAVLFKSAGQTDWQWWKRFLSEVKGRQKAFWLPTWRDDLTFVSQAPGEIVVSSEDGSDLFAWWPDLRQHIQIVEDDETVTYAEIEDAIDNLDGTITLTVSEDPASSDVAMISWLEPCRFESDDFPVSFNADGFKVASVARVVYLAPTVILDPE